MLALHQPTELMEMQVGFFPPGVLRELVTMHLSGQNV